MRRLLDIFLLVLLLCLVVLTGSGYVSIADIVPAASERPCQCGDECYGCPHDIDSDCVIDIVDIMAVASTLSTVI